ncbi:MAG: hypothetical protein ABIJ92_01575 [Candidatus Aenigmatarchaeota archaeon]
MFWSASKCQACKNEIEKGKEVKADVEIYGKVGKFKKNFCSSDHLEAHNKITEQMMKNRRVCLPCALR